MMSILMTSRRAGKDLHCREPVRARWVAGLVPFMARRHSQEEERIMKFDAAAHWLAVLVSGAMLCAGCSGSGSYSQGGLLVIVHDSAVVSGSVGEDTIDTAEIVGYDANGEQIYGPVREPYGARIVRSDVPLGVKSVTVDYLRNRGYPLQVTSFATDFMDDALHTEKNPPRMPHETPKSVWKAQMTRNCLLTLNGDCFKIKGICYSPSPIGYDASKFPALGDLFWDSFKSGGNDVWNWYSLWGSGHLYDQFYARDDLSTMRNLGVNAIRVYAFMSRQPVKVGDLYPYPANPGDDSLYNHFIHKQFLDQCYNNGVNPIYVLVGIPMSKALFQKGQPLDPNQQTFWEYVLDETTRDLANHPAVLGFTIMNEEDAEPWSHTTGNYTGTDKSDQFYYRAIQYATVAKTNAPDKLVGWASHDCPALYKFAALATFTAGPSMGKTYLAELAGAFDFWGVNTYQSTHFNSVLGNETVANGYTFSQIPAETKKPVIFTELGWPASGRDASGTSMIDTKTTAENTAAYLKRMLPLAYGDAYADLFAGLFYFEFSDEWWKSGNPNAWDITSTAPLENVWPNKYNDQEGYGLFSIRRGKGKQNDDPIWCGSGPCQPIDEMVPRLPLTNALSDIYKNLQ
jgi:hypothetical protein